MLAQGHYRANMTLRIPRDSPLGSFKLIERYKLRNYLGITLLKKLLHPLSGLAYDFLQLMREPGHLVGHGPA